LFDKLIEEFNQEVLSALPQVAVTPGFSQVFGERDSTGHPA
jgi:hypothetical protein